MAATKLTQSQTINKIADGCGLKKSKIKELFNVLAGLASSEAKKNGEFIVPGFGKLVKSTSKARNGRNPATGETITIPSKTSVKFRLGKAMKESIS